MLRLTILAFLLSSVDKFAVCTPVQAAHDASLAPPTDGFPNISGADLQAVFHDAHGTLPNASAPAKISEEGKTNLRLIAFGETMEVYYFSQLVHNITENVPGYEIKTVEEREYFLSVLRVIEKQEELHALNANNALKHFNESAIRPCSYRFPVSTLSEAIDFALHFTDLVVGTLQDVIQFFADNDDGPLTRGIAAAIGMEGEQMGWFRILQNRLPNELPFLTTSVRDFAFTAVNSLTVPGSCPDLNLIKLNTLEPLTLGSTPQARTEEIWFEVEGNAGEALFMTYINQQNVPVTVPLQVGEKRGSTTRVSALFPYDEHLLNGLTIAVTTTAGGPFQNARAAAAAAVHGPALIIVN